MPNGAIQTLLNGKEGRKTGRVRQNCFEPDTTKLTSFDSRAARAASSREQLALVERLREYAKQEHNFELSRPEAESALVGYIEEHASMILASAHGSQLWNKENAQEFEYVLGSFVGCVLDREPEMANYLERLVVGTMIASALYAEDIAEIERSFEGVEVYLDTPTLIDALGHAGDPPKQAQLESLRLISSVGAKLCCFEHTVAEIGSVLSHAAENLRGGLGKLGPVGSVEEHALQMGLAPADLEGSSRHVRERLARLGITVKTEPPHDPSLTIDEVAAEEVLRNAVKYPRPKAALRYDLDSLTATYRLRRGVYSYRIESCGAIFATTNTPLVYAALKVLPTRRDAVPIAIPLCDLTTLAWLKQPRSAPDLPKLRIAADCFAAVRPSEALIARYTTEAEALRVAGTITEHDVHELRYDVQARQIMMRRTLGSANNVTPKTILDTLEERHQQIRTEARADAERENRTLRERLERLEKAHESARETEAGLLSRRAQRRAKWITRPVFGVVFVLCLLLTISTLPYAGDVVSDRVSLARSLPTWLAIPCGLVVIGIPAIVFVLNNVWGISAKTLVDPIDKRLTDWLERRYRRNAVFSDDRS